MTNTEPILRVQHLQKLYPVKNTSLIRKEKQYIHAVDDVSFDLFKGQTLGLVGESGCGKSTVGRLLTGIEQPTGGEVLYKGQPIHQMKEKEIGEIRTQLQMIFQDPYAALNPKKRVWDILADPMIAHGLADKKNVGQNLNDAQLSKLTEYYSINWTDCEIN